MNKEAALYFFQEGHKQFMTNVSVDCVIFGFNDNQLKVLLLKWKGVQDWCLPGGFIQKVEHIDRSAQRILQERTNLKDIYLRQFSTFGAPKRNASDQVFKGFAELGVEVPKDSWLFDRFISIGYYALVNFAKVEPTADLLSEAIEWWDLEEIPPLIFDHRSMIDEALKALRLQLDHEPIGRNLLPAKFTLPELQRVYETILDKEIDRRNFRKKILNLGILNKLDERKKGGAHRAAHLYQFNDERYDQLLQEGSAW